MERYSVIALWAAGAVAGLTLATAAVAQTGCGTLSQCPVAHLPLSGNELLYMVQGGLSKQIGVSNFIGQNILPLNNTFTGFNTFNCNITTLSLPSRGSSQWCGQFNAIANGSSIKGSPGGLLATVTLQQPTANGPGGGFYVSLGTLSLANSGDNGAFTTLSGNALATATSVSVTSATNIVIGDFAIIYLDTGAPQSVLVSNVSGTTITFSPGLYANADSGNNFFDPKGNVDGAILQAEAAAGATGLDAVIGGTAAAYNVSGSSTYIRADLTIENDVPFTQNASGIDAMILMSGQSGITVGSSYAIDTSDIEGTWPLSFTNPTALWKAGGFLATSSAGAPAFDAVTNAFDFSTLDITGDFATWYGSNGAQTITGAGLFTLASGTFKTGTPYLAFNDTGATPTTGGLQRLIGDGAGDYIWQISLTGNFATSTPVYEITSAGVFNIQGTALKFQGATMFTGTKTAGSCAITIVSGLVSGITGC